MKLTLPNTTINYETFGTGQPIVFLHGFELDKASMIPIYEPLFEGQSFQRFYLDLPGMGQSQPLKLVEPTSDEMLKTIHQACVKLLHGRSAIIVGHSYGGYLAFGLAYRYPEMVSRLFLTCPVITAVMANRCVSQHEIVEQQAISREYAPERLNFLADYYQMNVVINHQTWGAYQTQIVPGIKHANQDFLGDLLVGAGHYSFSFETQLKQARLPQPVSVLLGHQDQVVGFKEQLAFIEHQAASQAFLLRNAGHNLPIDQLKTVRFLFRQELAEAAAVKCN